jgi:hypothetical protein
MAVVVTVAKVYLSLVSTAILSYVPIPMYPSFQFSAHVFRPNDGFRSKYVKIHLLLKLSFANLYHSLYFADWEGSSAGIPSMQSPLSIVQ